jgi:hypothetical protein
MIRRFLTPLAVTLMLGAALPAAERAPMPHAPLGVANGCFVESVALLDEWAEKRGADGWAKLLRWGAKEEEETVAGHAVAVVETNGRLWCWDVNFGWAPLSVDAGQRENVEAVVPPIVGRYTRVKAQYPLYMADFPQVAGASPVASERAAEKDNASLREALAVAERLARRRPVNVVTFTYGPEGNRRASAAAVFVYGGRYCLYVPEVGTVPTRAKGGVENLRLIQELLRRICLGAGDVRKR